MKRPNSGNGSPNPAQRRRRCSARWMVGTALVLAIPAAYFGGYLHAFSAIHAAEQQQSSLPHIVLKGGITGKGAANPTHAVTTPPANATPTTTVPARATQSTTTPSKAPVTTAPVSVAPTTSKTTSSGMAMATLSGTIDNGQLQAIVWAGTNPNGKLYPVLLMVDTGAQHTMISGNFWRSMGDKPTGETATYSGIGGNETVDFWPNVWILPKDNGANPIIVDGTEPGGVNRSVLGSDGITVLLGQNVIDQGTLVQTGDTWTFTYPVK